MKNVNSLLIIALFLCSCQIPGNKKAEAGTAGKSSPDSVAAQQKPTPPETRKNDTLDDIAAFLAGLKPANSAVVSTKDASPAWIRYRASAEKTWQRVDTNYLKKIKKWQSAEITDLKGASGDVFYPFSGPDIFTAYSLFPHSKRYVLVALEPVGNLPDLHRMQDSVLRAYLGVLSSSFRDVLVTSFFLTNNMAKDFNNEEINGVLPVLCLFLKRANCDIVNIEYLDNGTFKSNVKANPVGYAGKAFKSAKVTFYREGEHELKEIYYFQADLSDQAFRSNQGLQAFLKTLDAPCTFLKSASYLLHRPTFSGIRSYILDKSSAVLEDDSGIPFRYFPDSLWQVQLYGRYTQPITLFEQRFQPDLKSAFDSSGTRKPLPFRFGYGKSSNIVVATRKK